MKSRQVIEENIKKSRFIGVIVPCTSEIEVLQHLKQLLSKKLDGRILKQDFAEQVRLIIQLPAEQVNILLQSFPDT